MEFPSFEMTVVVDSSVFVMYAMALCVLCDEKTVQPSAFVNHIKRALWGIHQDGPCRQYVRLVLESILGKSIIDYVLDPNISPGWLERTRHALWLLNIIDGDWKNIISTIIDDDEPSSPGHEGWTSQEKSVLQKMCEKDYFNMKTEKDLLDMLGPISKEKYLMKMRYLCIK